MVVTLEKAVELDAKAIFVIQKCIYATTRKV